MILAAEVDFNFIVSNAIDWIDEDKAERWLVDAVAYTELTAEQLTDQARSSIVDAALLGDTIDGQSGPCDGLRRAKHFMLHQYTEGDPETFSFFYDGVIAVSGQRCYAVTFDNGTTGQQRKFAVDGQGILYELRIDNVYEKIAWS